MSDSDGVCRACLVFGLKLYRLNDPKLRGIYEKFAKTPLLREHNEPDTVCYVCYWTLQRCVTFSNIVHQSEKYLKDLLHRNLKVTKQTVTSLNLVPTQTLTIRPTVLVSYNGATDVSESQPVCTTPATDGAVETPVLPSFSNSSIDGAHNIEIPIKEEYIENELIFTKIERVSVEDVDMKQEHEFCCEKCQLRFKAENDFLSHIFTSHRKATYCVQCNKLFSSVAALSGHMTIHTGERPFSCNLCSRSFRRKQYLTDHIRMHEEKPYFCDNCNQGFILPDEFKRHLKSHEKSKPFPCLHCSKTFHYLSGLNRHMATHSGEKPYACNKCHASFKEHCALKKHMLTHGIVKPLVCTKCSKVFKHAVSYKRHLHNHNVTNTCVKCDNKFDKESDLDEHNHMDVKPYICEKCDIKFNQFSIYTKHMSSHDDIVESIEKDGEKSDPTLNDNCEPARLFTYVESYKGRDKHRPQCPVCKRHQHSPSQLKAHLRIHTGEKPYVCNECGRSFRTATFLKGHMRTHTGEKVCSCEICGKSFTQISSLNKHMVLHTGELPHSCQLCDKAYKQRGQLTAHIKNLHQGVRYFCDLCNGSFTAKQHLKRHMNAHAGIKPYSCLKCSQKFTTQTSVQRHMRNSCK